MCVVDYLFDNNAINDRKSFVVVVGAPRVTTESSQLIHDGVVHIFVGAARGTHIGNVEGVHKAAIDLLRLMALRMVAQAVVAVCAVLKALDSGTYECTPAPR